MTVTFPPGSIWDTRATYLAVPVNTVGVMGAGMAKAAVELWPHMLADFRDWCSSHRPKGGSVEFPIGYGTRAGALPVWVATKEHWRDPSRLEWVEQGLRNLRKFMFVGTSVALPLLGCGRGGLDPAEVERLILAEFGDDPERVAEVYR